MPVHSYTWIITIAVMLGLLIFDVLLMKRHPHKPSVKECSIWVSVYIGLAAVSYTHLTLPTSDLV